MLKFHVEKMKCGGCVAAAKAAIEKLPGVNNAKVDLESASAEVNGSVDAERVIQALTKAGYPARLAD